MTKNHIYKIFDKTNDIYINAFISQDDSLALQKVKADLKKTKYIFDNTQNIQEKASINAYFNNAKDYQLLNENNKVLFNFEEIVVIKEDKNEK